jgi:transcriptional regulator with XRE-family HTH domain
MGRSRPTVVDRLIGMRIRERRVILALSQRQLGELIGVKYQQVHKYEHGINSVSAGSLYEIARELGVPVEYFFEGLEKEDADPHPRQRRLLDIMRSVNETKSEKHQEAMASRRRFDKSIIELARFVDRDDVDPTRRPGNN